MSDSVYLGLKARQLEDSPAYQPISCVKLTIGGEDANGNPIVCTAGNPNSGRTIETSNPLIWDASIGNTVAQNILSAVQGYAYKPYQADGAIINPAVEIGDAVEVGNVYSIIADVETTFSPLMSATISAPGGSDIDHEYPYESSKNRELMQQLQGLKTSFIVENGRIAAEISDVNADVYGLSNRVTSVELTASGISANLSANYTTTDGMNAAISSAVNISAQSITSQVSATYETKTAANSKLNEAKSYSDKQDNAVKSWANSQITQSADSIKSTVAKQESKWDLSGLPSGVSISAFGYGVPSNSTASQYNNKYYLDQNTGYWYKSNGSTWARQTGQLSLITDNLRSSITQTANSIMSTVSANYATKSSVSTIEQKHDSISLTVSSSNGTTSFVLTDKNGTLDTEILDLHVKAMNVDGTIYADAVKAYSSIESPYINGGSISGTDILASRFMSYSRTGYLSLASDSYYDGTLYFGPTNYYQSRYNCYMCVSARSGYTTLDLGGTSMIMTQNGSARFSPGGVWDFSNCSQVIMPGGTRFP